MRHVTKGSGIEGSNVASCHPVSNTVMIRCFGPNSEVCCQCSRTPGTEPRHEDGGLWQSARLHASPSGFAAPAAVAQVPHCRLHAMPWQLEKLVAHMARLASS